MCQFTNLLTEHFDSCACAWISLLWLRIIRKIFIWMAEDALRKVAIKAVSRYKIAVICHRNKVEKKYSNANSN